jgi:hypothetical protein
VPPPDAPRRSFARRLPSRPSAPTTPTKAPPRRLSPRPAAARRGTAHSGRRAARAPGPPRVIHLGQPHSGHGDHRRVLVDRGVADDGADLLAAEKRTQARGRCSRATAALSPPGTPTERSASRTSRAARRSARHCPACPTAGRADLHNRLVAGAHSRRAAGVRGRAIGARAAPASVEGQQRRADCFVSMQTSSRGRPPTGRDSSFPGRIWAASHPALTINQTPESL